MKHLKKIYALLLALGTVCSLMAPAVAVVDNYSEYAGTTMKVQVGFCNFDGSTNSEQMVEVAIPVGATKADEQVLVQAAAYSAMGVPATRSGDYPGDLISEERTFRLLNQLQTVGGGYLERSYDTLIITFNNVTPYDSASEFHIKVKNHNYIGGEEAYIITPIRNGADTYVYMFAGDRYDDYLYLDEGDLISVRVATDWGTASVGTVYVSAI